MRMKSLLLMAFQGTVTPCKPEQLKAVWLWSWSNQLPPYQPWVLMRSLWTLRRDTDVWSVTTKTWQMESETIMQIKLKIIKKTNKNPFLIFASKFHQISGKEILKSFFSPLLLYRISSLLYLFFTIFAKVCSVECPSFKGQQPKWSFMEPAERSCLFPVLKTHLWGKMWPTQ